METATKEKGLFKHTKLSATLNKYPKFDINAMYAQAVSELSLQQSKRDQLITIYLAAFAFIVPAVLDSQFIGTRLSGALFCGLGIIGYLFALIIIRYRKYKESYWICCRTLNVMMTLNEEDRTEDNIQAIFYQCLLKKIGSYIEKGNFLTKKFVKKNLFSGETLYLVIHSLIAGCVLGLGVGMVINGNFWVNLVAGAIAGVALFLMAVYKYYKTLIAVYQVCIDKKEKSFNDTFGDAWFLHFFISDK